MMLLRWMLNRTPIRSRPRQGSIGVGQRACKYPLRRISAHRAFSAAGASPNKDRSGMARSGSARRSCPAYDLAGTSEPVLVEPSGSSTVIFSQVPLATYFQAFLS